MSFFEMLLLRRFFWDINAQPTVFSRRFFESWQDPPHDFSLDLFAYYKAKESGLPIKRFPVHFGDRKYGLSHWNIDWKSKIKFIKRTIDFSLELRKKDIACRSSPIGSIRRNSCAARPQSMAWKSTYAVTGASSSSITTRLQRGSGLTTGCRNSATKR